MYKVSEEHAMLRELVRKFVRNELMPLEKNILDRFAALRPPPEVSADRVAAFRDLLDRYAELRSVTRGSTRRG